MYYYTYDLLFLNEFYIYKSILLEESEQNNATILLNYEHSKRNCHEIKHSFPKNLRFSVITQKNTSEISGST